MESENQKKQDNRVVESAHVEGINTRALAPASHVEGLNTLAESEDEYGKKADASHAEGANTKATGWEAHAEGGFCWAEGLISHAENCITLASGNDSHTEGVQTVTGRRRYFIDPRDQGMGTLPDGAGAPYFIVRADAALNPQGDYTHEFVSEPVKVMRNSETDNPLPYELTWWRHNTVILFSTRERSIEKFKVVHSEFDAAEKCTRVFYENPETAFPALETIMMACASYAPEGSDSTYSDGKGQHAEGKRTNASGNFSHAEGRDTTCFGRYSHAEGYRSNVTGHFGAHAQGEATHAAGDSSHAQGKGTEASGVAAHAQGMDTQARGDASFAGGEETVAAHRGSMIVGQYGETDTEYAWHLAGGEPGAPALKARIDRDGAHHVGAWQSRGCGYAEVFAWQDADAKTEERIGRFVTLRGDRLVLCREDEDYIAGVVARNACAVGNDGSLAGNGMELGAAIVALVGRAVAYDKGACEADAYCRPGVDGIAVPAESGCRVLRRLDSECIEILLR